MMMIIKMITAHVHSFATLSDDDDDDEDDTYILGFVTWSPKANLYLLPPTWNIWMTMSMMMMRRMMRMKMMMMKTMGKSFHLILCGYYGIDHIHLT